MTKTSIDALILRQVFVVIVMIVVGHFLVLRKTQDPKIDKIKTQTTPKPNLKELLYSFLPISITVVLTAVLNVNIAIATFVGVATILVITKTKPAIILKILKNKAV